MTKDYPITVNNKQPCSCLLEELKKHQNVEDKKVNFVYGGRLMEPEKQIGSYVKEDGVITVIVRSIP